MFRTKCVALVFAIIVNHSTSRDVFLSYASEERDSASIVAALLERANLSVWWDQHIEAGQVWEREIVAQLDSVTAVLVLWTPMATVSEWVLREAAHALTSNKLVPITLKPCRLPVAFQSIQTSNLTEWDGSPDAAEWERVVGAIQRMQTQKR